MRMMKFSKTIKYRTRLLKDEHLTLILKVMSLQVLLKKDFTLEIINNSESMEMRIRIKLFIYLKGNQFRIILEIRMTTTL